MFHRNIKDNVLITYMKFLWKLHGNFGCHGNRSWKISNDISYESAEPILMIFQIKNWCDGYTILSWKGLWLEVQDGRHAHIW